jgi:hypothetical protein
MTHRQFEQYFAKELKPCAHCGKRPILVQWRDTLNPNATWIECKCGIMTDSYHHKEPLKAFLRVKKVWNKRVK